MNKRDFLALSTSALALGCSPDALAAPVPERTLREAGVTFTWRHGKGRLFGSLNAPTNGWIAVGFNNTPTLKDTRFVIADVASTPIRAEEHVALVPRHLEVSQLGLASALMEVGGGYANGISTLAFALPHSFPDWPALDLAPGARVHVMLAWSHETDFEHHSAWRRHYTTTL